MLIYNWEWFGDVSKENRDFQLYCCKYVHHLRFYAKNALNLKKLHHKCSKQFLSNCAPVGIWWTILQLCVTNGHALLPGLYTISHVCRLIVYWTLSNFPYLQPITHNKSATSAPKNWNTYKTRKDVKKWHRRKMPKAIEVRLLKALFLA